VELLRPVPSVALIPVALLVFGFGWRLEIAVVAFASCFPMLLLTRSAVQAVEPRLLEVAQVLDMGVLRRTWCIVLPAAVPRLFVALRLCAGIALVVAITTEVAANPQGLGFAMVSAQQNLMPDLMIGLLFWLALLGWGLNAGLLALQRRWFGAHAPMAEGGAAA
jgi:NitT/TauT family transport system permease protein